MSRVGKSKSPEAYALLLSSLAHAKLLYGDMQGTKTDMDEALKVHTVPYETSKTRINTHFRS